MRKLKDKKPEKMMTFPVRLPSSLVKELDLEAQSSNRSRNGMIATIVKERYTEQQSERAA